MAGQGTENLVRAVDHVSDRGTVLSPPTAVEEVVWSSSASAMVGLTVECGFLFRHASANAQPKSADLQRALAKTLAKFPTASGRFQQCFDSNNGVGGGTASDASPKKPQLLMVCNDGGVPFTHEVAPSDWEPPSMTEPVPSCFFDVVDKQQVAPEVPADAPADACEGSGDGRGPLGAPPLRVKVTDFAAGVGSGNATSHQLICVSVSHALVDATSIGQLMLEWSSAFSSVRGDAGAEGSAETITTSGTSVSTVEPTYEHSFLPPSVSFGEPPLPFDGEVPEVWNRVHRPFVMPAIKPYECWISVWARSKEEVEAMKTKHKTTSTIPSPLSTNDVIVGEVAEMLQETNVTLLMDCRPALNQPGFFGCALVALDFEVNSAEPGKMASEIRSVLQDPSIRTEGFVTWKLGRGVGKSGGILANSWVRAFDLDAISFGVAPAAGPFAVSSGSRTSQSCCEAVMLGEPFCEARAGAFAGMGLKYMIALPHRDLGLADGSGEASGFGGAVGAGTGKSSGMATKVCLFSPLAPVEHVTGRLAAVKL